MADLVPAAQYQLLPDNRGNPHFTFVSPTSASMLNTTDAPDVASFLHEQLRVSPRATTLLTSDLTPRDDVLLAVASLLLLVAIEAALSAFLLRTARSTASSHPVSSRTAAAAIEAYSDTAAPRFAVARLIERVRDLHLPLPFSRIHTHGRASPRLLIAALLLLVGTFAVEVAVLFLSNPASRPVHNLRATFSLLQPFAPEWRLVRFHARASLSRPCAAVWLAGVDQGVTSISACLTSDIAAGKGAIFTKVDANVHYLVESWLHRYGADHRVTITSLDSKNTANYSARAYYTLQDGRERLMCERNVTTHVPLEVYHIHRQYLAFLFSSYLRAIKDKKRISIKALQDVQMVHSYVVGEPVKVIQGQTRYVMTPSTKYTSQFVAPSVGEEVALTYASAVFRSAIGVVVTAGDEQDLFMESGQVETASAIMWSESGRMLNWFSMGAILIFMIIVLSFLRTFFQPVSTIDMAGHLVKDLVGANPNRAPLQMDDGEKGYFYVGLVSNGTDYRYGAETDDVWVRALEEEEEEYYDDQPQR